MTFITIALVVLSSGWLFSRTWLRSRYMALKEAGHPQYFAAAVAGVWLLTMGACLRQATANLFSFYSRLEKSGIDLLPHGIVSGESAAADFDFAACAMWCLVLSVLLPWLLNLPLRHDKKLLRAVLKRAGAFDAIEHITTHALDCGLPIAVTLKNKKVYIGAPISVSPIETERKWLVLFPILSGWRDDALKLDITVNYAGVYEAFQEKEPDGAARLINQFRIVLSVAEIVSLQTFNIETYKKQFQKDQSSGDAPSENPDSTALTGPDLSARSSLTEEDQDSTSDLLEDTPQGAVDEFTRDERIKMRYYYAFTILLTLSGAAAALLPPAGFVFLLLAGLSAAASREEGHAGE